MAVRGLSTHRDTTNVPAVLVTLLLHEVRDPEMSGVSAEVTGDNGRRSAASPASHRPAQQRGPHRLSPLQQKPSPAPSLGGGE